MAVRRRLVPWVVVATLGFAVQTTVLMGLVHVAHLHYAPATGIAVSAAILHNFLWHERWTWADRPPGRSTVRAERLLRFGLLSGLVSVCGGVGLAAVFVEVVGLPLPAANVGTLIGLGLVNLVVADRLAFAAGTRGEARHVPGAR